MGVILNVKGGKSSSGERGRKVHGTNQLATLILTLTALSDELPVTQISRLPSTASYQEKVLKLLKAEKLIRTYYRNGLRGLRLTARAKKMLSTEHPNRFVSLFTGDTATSTPKYTLVHRLRLHRMTEVLVTMPNTGVTVPLGKSRLSFPPRRSLTLHTLTGPLITVPARSKISV